MSAATERFSGDGNDCRVYALTTFSGSVFQMEEAAAGKARLPTVESLTDGTIRRMLLVRAYLRNCFIIRQNVDTHVTGGASSSPDTRRWLTRHPKRLENPAGWPTDRPERAGRIRGWKSPTPVRSRDAGGRRRAAATRTRTRRPPSPASWSPSPDQVKTNHSIPVSRQSLPSLSLGLQHEWSNENCSFTRSITVFNLFYFIFSFFSLLYLCVLVFVSMGLIAWNKMIEWMNGWMNEWMIDW